MVKTTPKPNATKKSNGELVGPPLLLPEPPSDVLAAGGAVIEAVGSDEAEEGSIFAVDVVCRYCNQLQLGMEKKRDSEEGTNDRCRSLKGRRGGDEESRALQRMSLPVWYVWPAIRTMTRDVKCVMG